MRRLAILSLLACAGCASFYGPPGLRDAIHDGPALFLEQAVVGPQGDGTYVVATNQVIRPAGRNVTFSGRPTDLALNFDESLLAVKNKNDVLFYDVATHEIVQTLSVPERAGNSFHGIAWTDDGMGLWTTDAESAIHKASRQSDGFFAWSRTIHLPGPGGRGDSAPGGFALDESQGIGYVALSRNNTIGIIGLETGGFGEEIPVGVAPYDILVNGGKAYVANWGGRQPVEGDVTGPSSGSRVVVDPATGVASTGTISVIDLEGRQVVQEIEVGLHPTGMVLSSDGARLYVANANSDSVSVIETLTDRVVDTLSTKPMDNLSFGSAPNALALSPDDETLYVANGGNNAIAVLDLGRRRVKGLIPTGWYPGGVVLGFGGTTIIVANTKGVGGRHESSDPAARGHQAGSLGYAYNSHDHLGSISIIEDPGRDELRAYTFQVAENMRLPLMHEVMNLTPKFLRTVPVPARPGETSVFKHVLYIIKENRTYDQVLGDLPQGNGDPSLTQFGRDVTPNQHALAEEFVLLDNFYCNGVLSADGHQWSTEGFVSDYLEKSFGGFTRSYPYDGDDALSYASSGFIWDYVLRAGLTFRDYGEFVQAHISPRSATWTDVYNDFRNGTRNVQISTSTELHTLEPYIHPTFIGFPAVVTDVYRAQMFIDELETFEAHGEMPNFMIMLLPNNHTVGTRPGYPTPRAAVADNDLALGRVVEAVSRSSFWRETAIFVVEDDPQNGLDHVDGRRTVALCISPYTKRHVVDSTHYNQNGMLRTMELILGLPPMNQLDLAATPMMNCFTTTPDFTPYTARPNIIPLDELNPPKEALRGKRLEYARISEELPLEDIDRADEGIFNRILWHATMGYDTPYPKLARRGEVGSEAWPGSGAVESDD